MMNKKNSSLDDWFLILLIFLALVIMGLIPFVQIFLGYVNSGLIYLISKVTFKGLLDYPFAVNIIFSSVFLIAYFVSRRYYFGLAYIILACFFLHSAFYYFVINHLPKNLYDEKLYFTYSSIIKPLTICSIVGLTIFLKCKFGKIPK